ncbi:unnamed protein product [Spirodela intermedia]|uniref:Uncharacterized protein n=1 Tax=Spirodela intermedia TaxID=51605 RepID=A0A7I8K031_SPIIN|nr:unnamed protein product [Spirodela intermedia]
MFMASNWMEVGRVLGSFILKSTQQEEALHRIWYALRRLTMLYSMPLSVLVTRALACGSSPTALPTHLGARLIRSKPSILGHLKMRLREGLERHPHGTGPSIKRKGNQGLINYILMPKIIVEKRLSGVHQDHHGSSITRPRTDAQRGLLLWRRDYLEPIKIVSDQAPLCLGLMHNKSYLSAIEKNRRKLVQKSKIKP